MSLIELKQVNKYVGPENYQQHILKDINLSIQKGEFISIIGQSGSGKSTLMNLLGCLDQASSGHYYFNEKDVSQLNPDELSELRLSRFGFVFQRYNLLNSLTALENVALPAIYSSLNSHERQKRAFALLTQLGLEEKRDNKPNEMSGGQQQRVSIARALMNGGEVILADEPTGALDSESGEAVLAILEELHRQGHTIILVTHDHKIAQRADRIIEIKDGQILSDQTKTEIPKIDSTEHYQSKNKFSFFLQILEAAKMSWHSILSNKLRSFLTMLGIIIGISSVTLIIALGEGAKQKIVKDWAGIKEVVLFVYPGAEDLSAELSRLSLDDMSSLRDLEGVSNVSPVISMSGDLLYENKNIKVSAAGIDAFELKIKNISLVNGRNINNRDVEQNAQIVVIDEQAAKTLFTRIDNAIGKTVLFNKRSYQVVGVGKSQYSSRVPEVWIPYSTLMTQMRKSNEINGLTILVNSKYDPVKIVEKSRQILIARHGIEDFQIFNSDESLRAINQSLGNMTFFISSVAFISLLVGGIGVMNIMLVSVTERIKEIGLRMAVGAKQSDVRAQFLIESAVLCLLGGLIGVSIALVGSVLFNLFSTEYMMVFSWTVAILALVFSSLIGLIFGYIPAKRASNLKPIEALAHE